jgi:hypothetical protein
MALNNHLNPKIATNVRTIVPVMMWVNKTFIPQSPSSQVSGNGGEFLIEVRLTFCHE